MLKMQSITLALMLGWSATVSGQNLISNPGFEAGNPSDFWGLWKAEQTVESGADATISFPDTGAPQGSKFARVVVTAVALENWHIQLQIPPDWVADSGTTYDLKFMARSDSSRSVHVGIQDGPDGEFAYRSGMDFSLTTEWTEYSLTYTSDRQGNGSVRFNLYLGLYLDTYEFDGFSLLAQEPVAIRSGLKPQGQALRVQQEQGYLALTLADNGPLNGKAELFDLQGVKIATAMKSANGSLRLAQPKKAGTYFIRATTANHAWVQKVLVR